MELLLLVWRQYRWPFISVMALSLVSAALGIGLIAFINQRLIETVDTTLMVLPEFLGLLLLLMVVTLGSQLALTTLGHHFVYRLRSEFIKRILDTHVERIEQIGSASLLAVLTSDIRNITIAFVRLPELVQGIILTVGSAAYLAMLSTKMLLVTAIWMAITIWGGFVLVARVYKHMATLRETEDKLYNDYRPNPRESACVRPSRTVSIQAAYRQRRRLRRRLYRRKHSRQCDLNECDGGIR